MTAALLHHLVATASLLHARAALTASSQPLQPLGQRHAALAELEASAQHHPCVLGVVLELHASCDGLSEDASGRLALALSNCHRVQSGRAAHPCDAATPLTNCASPLAMTESDFGVYTAFRLQVDSICRFVSMEATQHRAEAASVQLVRGARDAAAAVSTMAEDLSEMSERVDFSSRVVVSAVEGARDTALLSIEGLRSETEGVSSQLQGLQESSALALQRHVSLAEKQAALRDDVLNASAILSAAMDEHALGLQRGWHEGLAALQREVKELVFGVLHIQHDVFFFHSVFYFAGSGVVGWALTSAPRTRAARAVWFGLLLLEWAIEQGALASLAGYSYVLSPGGVRTCRRAAAACGCLAVIFAARAHIDPASLLQTKLAAQSSALDAQASLLREMYRVQSVMHDDLTNCLQLTLANAGGGGTGGAGGGLSSPLSSPSSTRLTTLLRPTAAVHEGTNMSAAGAAAVAHSSSHVAGVTRGTQRTDHERQHADTSKTLATAKLSYRELQAELKRRGLKAQGKTQELRLRLQQSAEHPYGDAAAAE
jgi:hypothetical protein